MQILGYEAAKRTGLATAKGRGQPGTLHNLEVANARKRAEANARAAAMEPVLRKFPDWSPQKIAVELKRRRVGLFSYKTVARARHRLGLPDWRAMRGWAARKAAKKAPEETVARIARG